MYVTSVTTVLYEMLHKQAISNVLENYTAKYIASYIMSYNQAIQPGCVTWYVTSQFSSHLGPPLLLKADKLNDFSFSKQAEHSMQLSIGCPPLKWAKFYSMFICHFPTGRPISYVGESDIPQGPGPYGNKGMCHCCIYIIDSDCNMHCFICPLSSSITWIKISVLSQCRILVPVQYMNTLLFDVFVTILDDNLHLLDCTLCTVTWTLMTLADTIVFFPLPLLHFSQHPLNPQPSTRNPQP